MAHKFVLSAIIFDYLGGVSEGGVGQGGVAVCSSCHIAPRGNNNWVVCSLDLWYLWMAVGGNLYSGLQGIYLWQAGRSNRNPIRPRSPYTPALMSQMMEGNLLS